MTFHPAIRRALTAAVLLHGGAAWAELPKVAPGPTLPPRQTVDVGVDPQLDVALPLDLPFKDHTGAWVTLGDYFGDGKPVLLSLNYTNCPKLCTVQLDGLADGLAAVEGLTPGEDFTLVSVSIDPGESTARAAESRRKYVGRLGRGDWNFLTGSHRSIKALAEAVGFRYRYDPVRNEFFHEAVAILCTPDGRTSRYLHTVRFDPATLKLSLLETSRGRIGELVDYWPLTCFRYDPESGTYQVAKARILMTAAGCGFVLLFGGFLAFNWMRSTADARASASAPADAAKTVRPRDAAADTGRDRSLAL